MTQSDHDNDDVQDDTETPDVDDGTEPDTEFTPELGSFDRESAQEPEYVDGYTDGFTDGYESGADTDLLPERPESHRGGEDDADAPRHRNDEPESESESESAE